MSAGPPPLTGLRVLEFAGLAPGPFAGLLLADFGASVLRIDRAIPDVSHNPGKKGLPTNDALTRHKSSIALDLKSASGVAFVKSLIPHVDIIIDPFRPGVLEKAGLGPDVILSLNPRAILGRMTGFRRDGKYKDMAGHDINYIAVSGALSLLGRKGEKPYAPANVLGDFAGGGAMLFQGILLALLVREKNGKGQVVEANMVDGSSYLSTFPRMLLKSPMWNQPRGENVLDGGCPWYDTYLTKDSEYMAVGALEPQFFQNLIRGVGLAGKGIEKTREDRSTWPQLRDLFANIFQQKTRSEWEQIFDGTDACCTPVLNYEELRADKSREGDQRPAVVLRTTPSLAVSKGSASRDSTHGQGPGVPGEGHFPTALYPSQDGEALLEQWLGWKRDEDFGVVKGGLVKKSSSKL